MIMTSLHFRGSGKGAVVGRFVPRPLVSVLGIRVTPSDGGRRGGSVNGLPLKAKSRLGRASGSVRDRSRAETGMSAEIITPFVVKPMAVKLGHR
jgi:hypothetical protein